METMPEARTQANFDKLPLLLSRAEFLHWTGLSGEDLDAMRVAGQVGVFRAGVKKDRKRAYAKYFKLDAARIAGMRL